MDTEIIGESDWKELQRNLEATIPVYDRINNFATLGQVKKWRKRARNLLPDEGNIIEIGCGPGSFAEDVEGAMLFCLDPIPEMLRIAESRVNKKRTERGYALAEFHRGTAEDLPFEEDYFDAACTLFSFRDWYDKRKGLSEAKRVLKPGGLIIIVDPAKINSFHGFLGYIWMKYWVGTYARLICKQKEHPWKWLTKTYVSFGTTKKYTRMLEQEGFENVKGKVIFPGMATIWTATVP
ncbi:MAG: class I SAM-dependent methyltransferase [Candidatus Poseidoniales archaeon]